MTIEPPRLLRGNDCIFRRMQGGTAKFGGIGMQSDRVEQVNA